jgi:hypothetical protein
LALHDTATRLERKQIKEPDQEFPPPGMGLKRAHRYVIKFDV